MLRARQRSWRPLFGDTRGANVVEYIVIVGVVALLALVGYRKFGGDVSGTVDALGQHVIALNPTTRGGDDLGACTGGMCPPGSGNCFVAGTPVATPEGDVPIERIATGDLVLSRDVDTGEVEVHTVGRTYVRGAPALVDVSLLDADGRVETVRATPEHRFWTRGDGWQTAGSLARGALLEDARGRDAVVLATTPLDLEAPVYNFEVDVTHTYFVGNAHVLVHNPNYPPGYVSVNDNQGNNDNNCYYVSTAALAGKTCTELEQSSGVQVPPGTATAAETAAFMQKVGVGTGQYHESSNPAQASQEIVQAAQNAAVGDAFGIGYTRPDGTGHIVTGVVDQNHNLVYVDFQTDPPTVAQGIDGNSVSHVTLFPTNVNAHGNPAFDQLGTHSQTAPGGVLR